MRRLIVIIIGVILLSGNILAQVATPETVPIYRLRDLSALEFLEALPNFETISYEQAAQLIMATEAEFFMRFGEVTTYLELRRAFDRFRPMVGYRSYRERIPVIDMNVWVARLTEHWLNENPSDLDSVEAINAYPLIMTIEPHDFDLDGEDEWILDVQYWEGTGDVAYRNFLIADGSFPQYHFLALLIPYTSGSYTWSGDNDYYRQLGFRDITADGQTEWLFATSELGPGGPGYTGTIYRVYALGWHEGEMVLTRFGGG